MKNFQIFKRRTGKIHVKRLPDFTATLYRDQKIWARHKAVFGSSTADNVRWTSRYVQYAAPHHDLTIVIGPHISWKAAAVENKRPDILYMLLPPWDILSQKLEPTLVRELSEQLTTIYNQHKRMLWVADFSGELLPNFQELTKVVRQFFKIARPHDGEAVIICNTDDSNVALQYGLSPGILIYPMPSKPHTARAVWGDFSSSEQIFIKY